MNSSLELSKDASNNETVLRIITICYTTIEYRLSLSDFETFQIKRTLAKLNHFVGNVSVANAYFKESLKLSKKLKENHDVSDFYSDYSDFCHKSDGKIKKAIRYAKKALIIARKNRDNEILTKELSEKALKKLEELDYHNDDVRNINK